MSKFVMRIVLLVLACGQVALPAQRELNSPPASRSVAPKRVKVSSILELRKLVGQEVTVYGKISNTAKSRGGSNFLNFYSSELSVVCFKENVSKFKTGAPADVYKNKDVEVTGTLTRIFIVFETDTNNIITAFPR